MWSARELILGNIAVWSLAAMTLLLSILIGALMVRTEGFVRDRLTEEWPARDKNGYILAHKEGSRWVNHWSKEKPGIFGLTRFLLFEKDNSNIPRDARILEDRLPILKPEWEEWKDPSAKIRSLWIGHATLWLDFNRGNFSVLTDPVFSDRSSPVSWGGGVKRYRAPAAQISELPPNLNAVVISHSHYDHCDLPSLIKLFEKYGNNLIWCVPKGLGQWLIDNVPGVNEDKVKEMEWWDEMDFDNGYKIAFTPSNHWSRRGLFDENKALWGSWTIMGGNRTVFFGGDTAYNHEIFKQIRKKYGDADLSLIPIGAYEPRWIMQYVHVNPEEAVKIHKDLGSKKSLGIHWGTFKLTYEYYLEPKEKIKELANKESVNFTTKNLGEFIYA